MSASDWPEPRSQIVAGRQPRGAPLQPAGKATDCCRTALPFASTMTAGGLNQFPARGEGDRDYPIATARGRNHSPSRQPPNRSEVECIAYAVFRRVPQGGRTEGRSEHVKTGSRRERATLLYPHPDAGRKALQIDEHGSP